VKYIEEYRDPVLCGEYAEEIRRTARRKWVLMEVCGGQTHTILRYGIQELLRDSVEFVHGPGCPVCVTPVSFIDAAVRLAKIPGVVLCTHGDMLRVPGTLGDLNSARASGGDVRVVYSPFDAVDLAVKNRDRQVIMFAVGFETTAPVTAAAVLEAAGLDNFSVLCCHVLVQPGLSAVLSLPGKRVQGVLAPGHVCTVTGWKSYIGLADAHCIPIVVAGFEPADILQAVLMCVIQLEEGKHIVENQYTRSVEPRGNPAAVSLMEQVFVKTDREWRGLGSVPEGGLDFRKEWSRMDALARFGMEATGQAADTGCLAGEVLTGMISPMDCPNFGTGCTPESPMGAPMVSSEGACAAYFRFGRMP
jgi:hydrogenase expression/formation protein HypD